VAVIKNLTARPVFLTDLDLSVPANGIASPAGTAASILAYTAVSAYVTAGVLSVGDDPAVPVIPVVNPAVAELAEQAAASTHPRRAASGRRNVETVSRPGKHARAGRRDAGLFGRRGRAPLDEYARRRGPIQRAAALSRREAVRVARVHDPDR